MGHLVCPKSAACFQLCSVCKICPKNHGLKELASLKHLDGHQLYAENKFKCQACGEEKAVGEGKVWHCGPCNHSICPVCLAATEALWAAAEEAKEENGSEEEGEE